MAYFNYHATVKKLISDGKLIGYKFVAKYKNIEPALLLYFFDQAHPVMAIRAHKFDDYLKILPPEKEFFD